MPFVHVVQRLEHDDDVGLKSNGPRDVKDDKNSKESPPFLAEKSEKQTWIEKERIQTMTVAKSGGFGKDGGPTGAFTYSTDPTIAAVQRQVKAVVERYQEGLNSSDFAIIRPLFAPHAVAEWNDKATMIGQDAMAGPYNALF